MTESSYELFQIVECRSYKVDGKWMRGLVVDSFMGKKAMKYLIHVSYDGVSRTIERDEWDVREVRRNFVWSVWFGKAKGILLMKKATMINGMTSQIVEVNGESARPIEFTHILDDVSGWRQTRHSPSDYDQIHCLGKVGDGLDMFAAYLEGGVCVIYKGRHNDGLF